MDKNSYVCPDCKHELRSSDTKFSCGRCKKDYEIIEGTPYFENSVLQPDNRTECEMKDLFALFETMKWKDALKLKIKPKAPLRYERIIYNRGADWLALLNVNSKSRVLDAGCGWGTISFQLADYCENVFAMDSSKYALDFIQVRSRQDGIKNIHTCLGNLLRLPFPDQYFDAVVLNGVLEWAGYAREDCDPETAQKLLLSEMRRVLKDDGQIYVGIENRYSATYFLGEKEGHVNLRYISLLPRAIAGIYHRFKKKTAFRAYTHSLNRYLSIFKECKFDEVSVYAPLPHYQKYAHLIPLSNVNAVKYYLHNMFSHTKKSAGRLRTFAAFFCLHRIIKYFVPCYSFIASKHKQENEIDKFLNPLLVDFETYPETVKPVNKYLSYTLFSGRNKIIIFPFREYSRKPLLVVNLFRPRDQSQTEPLFKAPLESTLHGGKKDSKNMLLDVPQSLLECEYGNHHASITTLVSGRRLDELIRINKHNFGKLKHYASLSVNWLLEFQRASQNGSIALDSDSLKVYIDPIMHAIEQHLDSVPDREFAIERLKTIEKSVYGKQIPLVTQHRDFGPANILLSGSKISVVDWEIAVLNGDPVYDLFYFIARFFFLVNNDEQNNTFCNSTTMALFTGKIFFDKNDRYHSFISDIINRHIQGINIDENIVKLLFLWHEINKNKNHSILKIFFRKEDDSCL